MFKELRFALYAIKKNIQSSAELRTSFLMNVVGMAINNTSFIILWTFFIKSVGVIGGWTAADIIGLSGFITLCFGITFSLGHGLAKLPDYVASGAFDRFMLSPKNLLLRVATSAFSASAVGDVVFGIICLTIYAIMIQASLFQIILMVLLIFLSITIFIAVSITIYSLSFCFTDPNSVTRGVFELFVSPSLFHGGAFQGAMRAIFTFAIPSLVVGALPVEAIKDASLSKLALIAVLAFVWFVLSIKIFNKAVRRYESSNFFTFGS